ncbi:PH domain-containing protein [Gemmatimonas sp.]|jgi:membrane protein YdbS with pleckstrin-like domain|uniref:PH domain-containing protein n=1 Tax=Gemmatimonas sp. TaxID=1962908 RepID=UPI0037BF79F2
MSSDSTTLTFRSRIDWWLVAIVFGALGSAAWGVGEGLSRKPTTGDWVAAVVTSLVLALVTWVFTSTQYEVGPVELVIRSGPLRATVPIATIRRVSASRTLLAGPALSLHRLEVDYGKYDTAIVSPADQAAFILALTARNPAIDVKA